MGNCLQNTEHAGEALDCLFWQGRWFFGGDFVYLHRQLMYLLY